MLVHIVRRLTLSRQSLKGSKECGQYQWASRRGWGGCVTRSQRSAREGRVLKLVIRHGRFICSDAKLEESPKLHAYTQ